MRTTFKSLLPPMLLAAGILGASAVSLLSSRGWAWAMAGPVLMGLFIVAAKAVSNRVVAKPDSYRVAVLISLSVIVASAMVAFADLASVPLMMPILGSTAVITLTPQGRTKCSRASSV